MMAARRGVVLESSVIGASKSFYELLGCKLGF
jgi:hypothetical protein